MTTPSIYLKSRSFILQSVSKTIRRIFNNNNDYSDTDKDNIDNDNDNSIVFFFKKKEFIIMILFAA